jgi:hypothetical protein
MKLEFSRHIFEKKKAQISSFIKIRPVGAKFLDADGQKDMKLTAAFHNFSNAPKNGANIWRYRKKFIRSRDQSPGICTPLFNNKGFMASVIH